MFDRDDVRLLIKLYLRTFIAFIDDMKTFSIRKIAAEFLSSFCNSAINWNDVESDSESDSWSNYELDSTQDFKTERGKWKQ